MADFYVMITVRSLGPLVLVKETGSKKLKVIKNRSVNRGRTDKGSHTGVKVGCNWSGDLRKELSRRRKVRETRLTSIRSNGINGKLSCRY